MILERRNSLTLKSKDNKVKLVSDDGYRLTANGSEVDKG
jgi:hypothetical protein